MYWQAGRPNTNCATHSACSSCFIFTENQLVKATWKWARFFALVIGILHHMVYSSSGLAKTRSGVWIFGGGYAEVEKDGSSRFCTGSHYPQASLPSTLGRLRECMVWCHADYESIKEDTKDSSCKIPNSQEIMIFFPSASPLQPFSQGIHEKAIKLKGIT